MQRLRRAIRTHMFPSIVQCSPVRTGSTLVWNALKTLFPNLDIPKRHDLNPILRSSWNPCSIIGTVRDPRDTIVSMLMISNEPATAESIQRKLQDLDRQGLREIMRIQNRPNTLILRYEVIYDNHAVLFESLENFFGIRHDSNRFSNFEVRFGIDEVMRRSKALGEFRNFDQNDHVHGRHISPAKGVPGGFRLILKPDLQEMIERHCAAYMKKFGYAGLDTKVDRDF